MPIYVKGDTITVSAGASNYGNIFSGEGIIEYTKGSNSVRMVLNKELLPFGFEEDAEIEVIEGWIDYQLLNSGGVRLRTAVPIADSLFNGDSFTVTGSGTQVACGYGKARLIIEDTEPTEPVVIFDRPVNLNDITYPFQTHYHVSTNRRATWSVEGDGYIGYDA